LTIGKRVRVIISPDGVVRGIHGPVVDSLSRKLGRPSIHRATYVEPFSELSRDAMVRAIAKVPGLTASPVTWWVDLSPSGTFDVLGPFDTNTAALAAEEEWLLAHQIPVPK
jgi:hypothetical protein